jgi:putative DNA primase/helicase
MQISFSYDDIRKQVLNFMTSLEIQPYDERELIFDGEIHRYRIHNEKRGHTSGAICIHTDGWPAGFVMDWRKGVKELWKYDASRLGQDQLTYFNSDEFKKKCAEQEKKANEQRKKKAGKSFRNGENNL